MASMRHDDAIPGAGEASPGGGWPVWALVSAFWLATSLLYAVQVSVMSSMPGERFRLGVMLAWQLPFWVLWAGVAPLILWLGRRFPLDGRQWRRSLPVHAGAWLALAVAHTLAAVAIGQTLAPSANERFFGAFRGFFLSRIQLELIVYAATLGVGHGVEYRQRLRARELSASRLEAQLAHARLDALRMQLNPHFLFNTLHTVAALVRAKRNDEAVRMIAGLSDLLRRTLEGTPSQQTTLAEELTFIERYLEIQRVRFGDRLRVELRIPADTRAASVPSLILQPLVENALRHGLAPRAAAGLLTIVAERTGDRLRLEVLDNGVGWSATQPAVVGGAADGTAWDHDGAHAMRADGVRLEGGDSDDLRSKRGGVASANSERFDSEPLGSGRFDSVRFDSEHASSERAGAERASNAAALSVDSVSVDSLNADGLSVVGSDAARSRAGDGASKAGAGAPKIAILRDATGAPDMPRMADVAHAEDVGNVGGAADKSAPAGARAARIDTDTMHPEQTATEQPTSSALDRAGTRGVGLANTRARLRHLYGDAASLALADTPGGGARVIVLMPYRLAEAATDVLPDATDTTDAAAETDTGIFDRRDVHATPHGE